ncbi:MAG: N-acetyltransferase [Candidatus Eremiobacteraeota bacterium]|nr:N-acetyltransferase [Candidatus Eremiobacteraeota bacterium]
MTVADTPKVHPTAIVEPGVTIGAGTSIWDSAHVRRGASIGDDCIIGEKTYVAYDVRVGHRCKINAMVYLCAGVTLEDGVMVSAGTVFTNDRYPRAATPDLLFLRTSEPDENTLLTHVRAGVTIGANVTIGPGVEIGRFAMIGMGSIVTRSIPDFHLAIGTPARSVGCVCRCGRPLLWFSPHVEPRSEVACNGCGRRYKLRGQTVEEIA